MEEDQDLTQMQEVEEQQETVEAPVVDTVAEDTNTGIAELDSEDTEVVEDKPTPRENRRIQKLIDSMRASSPQGNYEQPQVMDYRQKLDIDNEEVYNELNRDREVYGQAEYNKGISQANFIQTETRIELDAPKVAAKYSILNPESSDFDPSASDTINRWYLQTIGYDPNNKVVSNPNLRYTDFVEGIMEMSNLVAGRKVAESTTNIAKQVASTGLRPNGTQAMRSQSFTPEDIRNMSSEEYEKNRDAIQRMAKTLRY